LSFVAEAEITVSSPPEVVFDRLLDHASWHDWMPRSFRPIARTPEKLSVGARIKTQIARAPVPTVLEVTVCDRPREITWCGGTRGLLRAEHRFLFEPTPSGGTRIRSVETWRGILSLVVKPIVKRVAEKIGKKQIEALAKAAT
jgi:hypothetical protein